GAVPAGRGPAEPAAGLTTRRVTLALAGLVLCAAGGLILWLGVYARGRAVLDGGSSAFVRTHAWFWPMVLALEISLAVLGLCWVCAQSRAAALRRFVLVGGSARLMVRAATVELAEEIASLPGVQDVRVRLTGSTGRPRLVLSVLCEESADLGLLFTHIGEDSLVWFRDMVSMPELHTVLRFRLVYQERHIA
ncbi:MAG: hypothetical protein ABIS86_07630, partial [Streptosporangiaceae bacterium]